MSKVALVLIGSPISPHSMKGLFNSFINRALYLKRIAEFDVDVFYLQVSREKFSLKSIICLLSKQQYVEICGVKVRILKKKEFFSNKRFLGKIIRWVNRHFNERLYENGWMRRYLHFFATYDLISSHFCDGAELAKGISIKYGIPFCVTWHGSDIHTIPFQDDKKKREIIESINRAECNFFVSRSLKKISDELTPTGKKVVLRNGISDNFYCFPPEQRDIVKKRFGVIDKVVVSFAGTLRSVKNSDILPEIFGRVFSIIGEKKKLVFWIIGDGEMRNLIEDKLTDYSYEYVMFGDQLPEVMPQLLNCTDILVLPSKNEGLPLIAMEALACGANVVGSRVGGIPEIIGDDYTVELGDRFIDRFADKVASVICFHSDQSKEGCNSWESTASLECSIYKEILA